MNRLRVRFVGGIGAVLLGFWTVSISSVYSGPKNQILGGSDNVVLPSQGPPPEVDCEPPPPPPKLSESEAEAKLRSVAGKLDFIEKEIEEWGHASATGLILINPGNKENRGFTHVGFNDTYANVKQGVGNPQGKVAISRSQALRVRAAADQATDTLVEGQGEIVQRQNELALEDLNQAGLQEQINDEIQLARGKKLLEHELNSSLFPELPEGEEPDPGSPQKPNELLLLEDPGAPSAGDALGTQLPQRPTAATIPDRTVNSGLAPIPIPDDFTEPQKLFQDAGVTISESDKIKLAISAMMGGKVADFHSDPVGLSSNKVAFLALSQVSVSPGWRTRENYACEIQLYPSYAEKGFDECTKRVKWKVSTSAEGDQTQPISSAAFPLAEAQILDLQFSQRQQFQMLLDVANSMLGAGQTRNANLILDYVRRYERDVATRNAMPTVVPSSDGTQITYRFQPSLQAIDAPFRKRGKPAQILNPISIPVMIVVVCDADELKKWDSLAIQTSVRWIPIEKQSLWSKIGSVAIKNRVKDARRTNVSRMELARCFENAAGFLGYVADAGYGGRSDFKELRYRAKNLETLGLGLEVYSELPIEPPLIHKVSPSSLTFKKADQKIYVVGSQFLPRYGGASAANVRGFLDGVELELVNCTGDPTTADSAVFNIPADVQSNFAAGTSTLEIVTEGGRVKVPITIGLKSSTATALSSVGPGGWKSGGAPAGIVLRGKGFKKPADPAKPPLLYIGHVNVTCVEVKSDQLIVVTGKELKDVPPGTHDVDLIIEGEHVHLSEGIKVTADRKPPAVVDVWPQRGFRYAPTYIAIRGENLSDQPGKDAVKRVLVAGRNCRFQVVSSKMIVAIVPPWAKTKDRDSNPPEFSTNGERAEVRLITETQVIGEDAHSMYFNIGTPEEPLPDDDMNLTDGQEKLRDLLLATERTLSIPASAVNALKLESSDSGERASATFGPVEGALPNPAPQEVAQ